MNTKPVPKYTKWRGIAGKLNYAQISMVMSLRATPCILGCSEVTAARLAKQSGRRPALTEEVAVAGSKYPQWRLNVAGLEVQSALTAMLTELLSV